MSVQKVEQGGLGLSPKMAARISEVLDLDSNWLLANNSATPPITREGGPWQKGHYELARMNSTTWGRLAQTPPLPKSEHKALIELEKLHQGWQTEELSATIAALLAGARKAGGAKYGITLFRLKKAIDEVVAQGELDFKVLAERAARIDEYRKPYLASLARLEDRAAAELGPENNSKTRAKK